MANVTKSRSIVETVFTTPTYLKNLRAYFMDINWQIKNPDMKTVLDWADRQLRNDPFSLAPVKNLGIKRLDSKLVHLPKGNPYHLDYDDPKRAEALMHAALQEFWMNGRAIVPLHETADRAIKIMLQNSKKFLKTLTNNQQQVWQNQMYQRLLQPVIPGVNRPVYDLVTDEATTYDGDDDLIVDHQKREMIIHLVDKLLAISNLPRHRINHHKWQHVLTEFGKAHGFLPSDEQIKVTQSLLRAPLSLLVGFAGVGKTTSLKLITDYLQLTHHDFVLCAPSGRAADNLRLSTQQPAKTIASLTTRHQDILADYVIVDEVSMVGEDTLNELLKLLGQDTRLILVGDGAQLPAVKSVGFLTGFLTNSPYEIDLKQLFNYQELQHVFRQAGNSQLLDVATAVRNQELPDELTVDGDKTLQTMVVPNIDMMIRVADRMWRKYPQESNVIVTANRRVVDQLNRSLQKSLHQLPANAYLEPHRFGTFVKGDQVMVTQNYNKVVDVTGRNRTLANGFIGYVMEVYPAGGDHMQSLGVDSSVVLVRFGQVGANNSFVVPLATRPENYLHYLKSKYDLDQYVTVADLDDLQLAYAVTVHKAQGSTINRVIYYIDNTSSERPLKKRQNLYTALTRASAQAIVVVRDGDPWESLNEYLDDDAYATANSYLPLALHTELVKRQLANDIDDQVSNLFED